MSRENVLLEAESFTTVKESQISEETKEKSQTENGVYVKGMALPFGKTSRNGVQYEKESVKEAHGDLVGRTMLFNHKQDWVTGHILNTEITDKGMYFEGDINPNAEMPNGVPVAEAIDRGDINSVSIQAFIEQLGEPADEDAVIDDMETEKVAVKDFLEISAVSIPGFPQAEALPEHLQHQGVKPVTEALGVDPETSTEQSNETEEVSKEQFEFNPVPSHVLYGNREDAMQRARNLGLDNIHEHEMEGQIYYMAGDNHEEWLKALDRENPTDRENREEQEDGTRGEPFAGYDDFEACLADNQDKDDPEAYCGEIKDKAEELEDDTMSNEDDNNQEEDSAQSEQVNQEAFIQFVAEHMEGLEAGDIANAVGDSNFTGLDQGEVAKLLAMEFELDEDTVMDVIGQLEDMEAPEEEGDSSDDDEEDDMNEEDGETEEESEESEEDKTKEELKDKVEKLEKQIETILDNDEGKSKQSGPRSEEDQVIERRPSFKGLTD